MKLENKKGEYLMALVDLTSVTTGSIGTNTNFIVEENKVLKRISQSSLLKTSAISTTHVNSTTNVPSSSLVYSMNQAINTLNSDLIGRAIYATDLFAGQETPIFVLWEACTQNTPYKQGLTDCTLGFGLAGGNPDTFFTVFTCTISKNELYMYSVDNGAPTGWEKIYPK